MFSQNSAHCYVTRTLNVLFCLDTVTSKVKLETTGSPNKRTDLNGVKNQNTLFFCICCTVFALLLRLNKAHHNFFNGKTCRWLLKFVISLICNAFCPHLYMLLQSIPQYVNLYLNITVRLKLRNGTTSHVVFC